MYIIYFLDRYTRISQAFRIAFLFSFDFSTCAAANANNTQCPFSRSVYNGHGFPIHVGSSVWSLYPSSVFGWMSTLSGPRCTASQEKSAPVWCGVKVFTSNIATGWGPKSVC